MLIVETSENTAPGFWWHCVASTCIESQSSSSQAHTHPGREGNWCSIVWMVMLQTSEPFIWHPPSWMTETQEEGGKTGFSISEQGLVWATGVFYVPAALTVFLVMSGYVSRYRLVYQIQCNNGGFRCQNRHTVCIKGIRKVIYCHLILLCTFCFGLFPHLLHFSHFPWKQFSRTVSFADLPEEMQSLYVILTCLNPW